MSDTKWVRFGWCMDGHCSSCICRSGELACNHECHTVSTVTLPDENETIKAQETGQAVRQHRNPGPRRSNKEID